MDRKRELKLLDDDNKLCFIVGGKWESKLDDDDKGEGVNGLWDIICVIPTDKEKVECHNTGRIDQAVAT